MRMWMQSIWIKNEMRKKKIEQEQIDDHVWMSECTIEYQMPN